MITYLEGDATQPQTDNPAIITHVCNDIGAWGAGFVMAVTKRWIKPEAAYRQWFYDHKEGKAEVPFKLGHLQMVQVEDDLWVANMIGQSGVRGPNNPTPVRYESIGQALQRLANMAVDLNAEVHMPRIGCGLAGGRWSSVEPLVLRTLVKTGVPVFVYDLPSS